MKHAAAVGAFAAVLQTHVLDDFEARRDVLEHLGDFLAAALDRDEGRFLVPGEIMFDALPRQMLPERVVAGPHPLARAPVDPTTPVPLPLPLPPSKPNWPSIVACSAIQGATTIGQRGQ